MTRHQSCRAGQVGKWDVTDPSNWRAQNKLSDWLAARGKIAISGVDTCQLTRAIRAIGAPMYLVTRGRTV